MSAPRAKIAASLAERGRPELWANEQEAAVLSGMAYESFRLVVLELERRGFPRQNPNNGKRWIDDIIRFWAGDRASRPLPATETPPQDGGAEVETFQNGRKHARQRLAS